MLYDSASFGLSASQFCFNRFCLASVLFLSFGQPELVEGISMATCRRNSAGFPHRIRSFLLRRGAVWAIQQSVVQPCAALWCTVYLCGMYFWYTWWQPAHVCNHNRFFRFSFRLRVLYWPAGQQVSCFQHAQRPTCLAVGRQANPCVACLRRTCIKTMARSVPQVFHTQTHVASHFVVFIPRRRCPFFWPLFHLRFDKDRDSMKFAEGYYRVDNNEYECECDRRSLRVAWRAWSENVM